MSLATKILALATALFACAFVGTASGDALPYHARAMASVGVELPSPIASSYENPTSPLSHAR
jgi:hypothetical protein